MALLTSRAPTDPYSDDDQDDRWCMTVRLLGQVEKELDDALRTSHGLPLSDYRALCALSRPDSRPALRMGELAGRIGLQISTVTRLVGRLEARGLVERRGADGDGRAVTATVTASGRKHYRDVTPTYRRALGRALSDAVDNVYLADLATWVLSGESGAGATSRRRDV
ncbi:MarR family winged helix-turn-helix transcriptional regulator [Solicola gregarius]|uniref:MarR family transcriptional regulator n=1 Tax=Solicola gregarius TaxID=2908642 RepID=A0AA46TI53_9ACTN|nr:MarR family transcriptional regulator [Solicola gregarius]UYM05784.1 MarR family transcriptional regulator [Solicola gregarius]